MVAAATAWFGHMEGPRIARVSVSLMGMVSAYPPSDAQRFRRAIPVFLLELLLLLPPGNLKKSGNRVENNLQHLRLLCAAVFVDFSPAGLAGVDALR